MLSTHDVGIMAVISLIVCLASFKSNWGAFSVALAFFVVSMFELALRLL